MVPHAAFAGAIRCPAEQSFVLPGFDTMQAWYEYSSVRRAWPDLLTNGDMETRRAPTDCGAIPTNAGGLEQITHIV